MSLSRTKKPNISILIPCYNEEAMVEKCVLSCLNQTRPADQVIFVDDCSKDRTPEILARYADRITVLRTPKNTGNKSSAQEYGLRFVTGDIMVTTDADTILDPRFIEEIIKEFKDSAVGAASGYVRSMKYNWLTRCRAFEYSISQNIHKLAQSYIGFMFVIPGAAAAFRTQVFRDYCTFDHDTITEDLDFTYKIHKAGYKIAYNRKAVVNTQDPATLHAYRNQLRRWYGGGWQNLVKHLDIIFKPAGALELGLIYIEGVILPLMMFILPLINLKLALLFFVPYLVNAILFGILAAYFERRIDLVLAPFAYMFLMYVNAYILVEQCIKEVILRKKNLVWFKPDRVQI
ncbi:MAG TPA: glycosyltransferase family 2 protein [Candidatus Paceibacterota bacterium]|nr:glycosyltransferase family 2 protein [Candidatus Paceibacterota bacterium]